jgi:geranylgeranyl diphosphate synthase type I
MTLADYSQKYLPAIDQALKYSINSYFQDKRYHTLRNMMAYHLGWEGDASETAAQGKRIRPQVVLLCCEAVGGNWQNALPAAAAIELIHNFSLIHDDIEDRSDLRHGRKTIWAKWGDAQAVNTGDAMFTLANLALLNLKDSLPEEIVVSAVELLQQTCFELTRGQFLDISYENEKNILLDDYWPMIGGKTAALLAGSAQMGSLIGGARGERLQAVYRFGYSLGLAFQAQDDALGIWGNEALLGKSTNNDLVTGKKTLPVVYALERNGPFAKRWLAGPITLAEIPLLAQQLRVEGAEEYTISEVGRLTGEALSALREVVYDSDARKALEELAMNLLQRVN